MTTYYCVLGSQCFLGKEEFLREVFEERAQNYEQENQKIDF
jgi:hypothetical protein